MCASWIVERFVPLHPHIGHASRPHEEATASHGTTHPGSSQGSKPRLGLTPLTFRWRGACNAVCTATVIAASPVYVPPDLGSNMADGKAVPPLVARDGIQVNEIGSSRALASQLP